MKPISLFLSVCLTVSAAAQTDLTALRSTEMPLTVLSGGMAIDNSTPLVSLAGSRYYMDFRAKTPVSIRKVGKHKKDSFAIGQYLLIIYNKNNGTESRIALPRRFVDKRTFYSDPAELEVSFYYYDINLKRVPLPLLLDAEKIDLQFIEPIPTRRGDY